MAGFNLPITIYTPQQLAQMAQAAFKAPALMGMGGGGGGGGMGGGGGAAPGFDAAAAAGAAQGVGALGAELFKDKPPTVQDLNQWGISEANPTLAQAMRDSPNIDFRTRQANTDIASFSTPPGGEPGWFSRNFGGERADGGPVMPGQYYTVGERGPETFVPNVPGQIVPNEERDFFGGRRRR